MCSSPLSTTLDTTVLEVSFNAINGNILSFNSDQSINEEYVRLNRKVYFIIDYITNLRKGLKPL
jgi:hypothetical protein